MDDIKDKKSGVLMPIFSLPSKYGIGSLGKRAFTFADFLKKAGQTYWQILPIVPTGYCDSPYQTVCGDAGNPYFIDLEILRDKKLLTYREVESAIDKSDFIDYGKLYKERYLLLKKAFSRFDTSSKEFKRFLKTHEFDDYALFMALSEKYKTDWNLWPAEYATRDSAALSRFLEEEKNEILFWQFLQFEFWSQYYSLKKYTQKLGLKIIGDLPLYPSYNSVEVWVNKSEFLLDEDFKPKKVAGVPPDYFSKDGQLWGNPVYDYSSKNIVDYWKKRVDRARKIYDLVRIDHFRGLDRFWAVDPESKTAENGKWLSAPGREIFRAAGTQKIIAEDLGILDEGVYSLIKDLGLYGMKVLSFAFSGDENNAYLPWNVGCNSVIYTGTHDNDTLVGYIKSLNKEELERQKKLIALSLDYLKIYKSLKGVKNIAAAIVDIAYASAAKIAVIPIQDILYLGSDFRINTPGKTGCWRMRIKESVFTKTLASSVKRLCKRYKRT